MLHVIEAKNRDENRSAALHLRADPLNDAAEVVADTIGQVLAQHAFEPPLALLDVDGVHAGHVHLQWAHMEVNNDETL